MIISFGDLIPSFGVTLLGPCVLRFWEMVCPDVVAARLSSFIHWENCVSISFLFEWDMIVVTVFILILNQMEFHFVQNRKEKLSPRSYPTLILVIEFTANNYVGTMTRIIIVFAITVNWLTSTCISAGIARDILVKIAMEMCQLTRVTMLIGNEFFLS